MVPNILHKIPEQPFNPKTISPTDETEILEIISNLRNKPWCCDGIHPRLIEMVETSLAKPLFIDKAIELGKCLPHFNSAEVPPIFKTGDRKYIGNYRPISVLSSIT